MKSCFPTWVLMHLLKSMMSVRRLVLEPSPWRYWRMMVLRRQRESQALLSWWICYLFYWSSYYKRNLRYLLFYWEILKIWSVGLNRFSPHFLFAMVNTRVYVCTIVLPDAIIDDIWSSLNFHNLQMLLIRDSLVKIEIMIMDACSLRCDLKILLWFLWRTVYGFLWNYWFWDLRFWWIIPIVRCLRSCLFQFELCLVVNNLSSCFIYWIFWVFLIINWVAIFQVPSEILGSLLSNFFEGWTCQVLANEELRVPFFVWRLEKLCRSWIYWSLMRLI